ncbi:MAG: PAS domain-containing protein [Flavobacteriales bacterium]|nr:PAS domain-containing protein [Flavobacteriales bacterium]
MKEAKLLMESARVKDYDKFLRLISEENPLFATGEMVLFLVDLKSDKILYVSANAIDVEGYSSSELTGKSTISYFEMMHPDDAETVMNKVFIDGMTFTSNHPELTFDKFKVSYNYRLLQKDGNYRMLLQQFSYISVDNNQNPIMLLGTIIDISEIYTKSEIFCKITTLNHKGKWVKAFERYYPIHMPHTQFNISEKEMEIISFVAMGMSSKEIANLTNRSVETVNTQRKSVLSKTGCKSMTEVVIMAKDQHWI